MVYNDAVDYSNDPLSGSKIFPYCIFRSSLSGGTMNRGPNFHFGDVVKRVECFDELIRCGSMKKDNKILQA
jgi:hypothetical protein